METEIAQLKEQVKALTARVNQVQGRCSMQIRTSLRILTQSSR